MSRSVASVPLGGYSISADGVPSYAREPEMACAFCDGDGEVVNPGNADSRVAVVDWLHPVVCPRCGGTGKEPHHG